MKTRWSESCLLIGCLPYWSRQKKFSFWPYYISFINQVCSIKMVGYWPRFFLRFDWPWLRLGPTLCARGFSCAVPGFSQVLKSDPLEKHALLTSVMAGYSPSFFFFFAFTWTKTPWVPEVYSCARRRASLAAGRGHERRSREKKPLVPRVSRSMKTQKVTWPISSHHVCQQHMLFAQVTFLRLDRKPRMKSLQHPG